MPDHDPFTYRVAWSAEDGEYVGLCEELPSLSWLDATAEAALLGIRRLVAEVLIDLQAEEGLIPGPQKRRP